MKQKVVFLLVLGMFLSSFKVDAQLLRWDKFVHVQSGTKYFKTTKRYPNFYKQHMPFVEAGFALMQWDRVSAGASLGYGSIAIWPHNQTFVEQHEIWDVAYMSLFSRIYLINGYRNQLYFLAKGIFGAEMYKMYVLDSLNKKGTKFVLTYNFMAGYDVFLTEHLGIYVEAGWGMSLVNGGIVYKL